MFYPYAFVEQTVIPTVALLDIQMGVLDVQIIAATCPKSRY
jgi:hypothetical protein